jgi:hypothetical protein
MDIGRLAVTIMAVDATKSVFERTRNSIRELTKDVNKLWADGKKGQAILRGLNGIGTGAAWATAGLVGITGAHQKINALADAQDALNQIRVLGGKSEDEMAAFRSKIYEISSRTGQGAADLLAAAQQKMRRGMADADIFSTLETEAKYAKATFSASLAGISDATHFMVRQMKLTPSEVNEAFAGLHHISKSRAGQVKFEDFMGGAADVMGQASNLGMAGKEGIAQLYAAAQVASQDTRDAAGAMAGVSALLADMRKAKTEKSFEAIGLDFDALNKDAWQSGDYINHIVAAVADKTKGLAPAARAPATSKIFQSEDSKNLIRSLASNQAKYRELVKGALEADGKGVAKDLKTAQGSLKAQWGLFNQQLTATMDTHITPWLEGLTGAIGFLNDNAALSGGVFAVLAAGLAAAAAVKMTNAVIGLYQWAAAATTAQLAMAGMVIGIVLIAAGAYMIYKNWDKISAFFKKLWEGVKNVFFAAWGAIKGFFADLWDWAAGLFAKAWEWASWLFPLVKVPMLIIRNWDKIRGFFGALWDWAADLFAKAWEWASWLFPLVKVPMLIIRNWDKIRGFFGALWGGVKAGWSSVVGALSGAVAWVRGLLGRIAGVAKGFLAWYFGIPGRLVGAIAGIGSKLFAAGKNVVQSIWDGIKTIWGKFTGWLDQSWLGKLLGLGGKAKKGGGAIGAAVAGEVDAHLPHSPARKGPLRDLHRVRLVETLAESVKAAPLTSKLGGLMARAKDALAKTPLSIPAKMAAGLALPMKGLGTLGGMMAGAKAALAKSPISIPAKLAGALGALAPPARALGAAALSMLPAAAGRPSPPIHVTINIDARGAQAGAKQDIEKAVLAAVPKIERAIQAIHDRRERASNGGLK